MVGRYELVAVDKNKKGSGAQSCPCGAASRTSC